MYLRLIACANTLKCLVGPVSSPFSSANAYSNMFSQVKTSIVFIAVALKLTQEENCLDAVLPLTIRP